VQTRLSGLRFAATEGDERSRRGGRGALDAAVFSNMNDADADTSNLPSDVKQPVRLKLLEGPRTQPHHRRIG